MVVGNTLTLNCTFEGDPLPSVLWSQNMTMLNVSTDLNLSETLFDVTFNDHISCGFYQNNPHLIDVQGNPPHETYQNRRELFINFVMVFL